MYRHAALYDMSTRVHRKTRALCRKLIRQLPGQTLLSVYTYIKLPCLPQLACRILLFRRGKKCGSRGARKLWLYDEKKVSLTRLAGSTRELGQRVNAVHIVLRSVCLLGQYEWCMVQVYPTCFHFLCLPVVLLHHLAHVLCAHILLSCPQFVLQVVCIFLHISDTQQ